MNYLNNLFGGTCMLPVTYWLMNYLNNLFGDTYMLPVSMANELPIQSILRYVACIYD